MQRENVNDLLGFLAVAQERSFTKAAFALLVDALRYRSQPGGAK